ncbi:GFA family protein [uncultured Tateyamaria sp.]|uniref:GFA family protein n=1 Tax=uncultured Tateyamaria sp. TaxID=455651 RepID=UPI00260670C5|nr:GFA family protein [uncultured Tateyamaria sp.]
MSRSGSCMCGAVKFTIAKPITETGACHCSMCRKWSGGVFLGVQVPKGGMQIEGEDNLTVYTSSEWAERAFCKHCGSSMFYRVTAPGPMNGDMHVGMGTFADASGIPLTGELFIDLKPDGYAFAGEGRHQMTETEVMAMFAAPPEEHP